MIYAFAIAIRQIVVETPILNETTKHERSDHNRSLLSQQDSVKRSDTDESVSTATDAASKSTGAARSTTETSLTTPEREQNKQEMRKWKDDEQKSEQEQQQNGQREERESSSPVGSVLADQSMSIRDSTVEKDGLQQQDHHHQQQPVQDNVRSGTGKASEGTDRRSSRATSAASSLRSSPNATSSRTPRTRRRPNLIVPANIKSLYDPHWIQYEQDYQYLPPEPRPPFDNANADGRNSRPYNTTTLCGESPMFDTFFNRSLEEHSRLGEDRLIYNLFFQSRAQPGRYVEMGAFNGIRESNTRFFDECLGWEGLLIEPNPQIYPALRTNRPFSHRMSFAPSCSESNTNSSRTETKSIRRRSKNDKDPQTKTVGFHAISFTSATQDGLDTDVEDPPVEHVQVPCGPLTPILLDVFRQRPVTFFSLDVEGAEADVLENLDLSLVKIRVMIVESKNRMCRQDCEARVKVRRRMVDHGYRFYPNVIPASDLFVHPAFPTQLPAHFQEGSVV